MKATTAQFAQMHSQMRAPYLEYDRQMIAKGIDYKITSVARFVKEQVALYAQGRNPLEMVNMYRQLAGLGPIKEADNKIVTWTLKSDHLIDLDDDNPDNDYARAFDIVIMNGKIPTWDLKADVNHDSIPDYKEAALIGKSVGFDPGFFWKKQDPPHYSWKLRKVTDA
jgi:hypothetical protein